MVVCCLVVAETLRGNKKPCSLVLSFEALKTLSG